MIGPVRIYLRNGGHVLVDIEDFESLNTFSWNRRKNGGTCYAVRRIKEKGVAKIIWMHREISGVAAGLMVDHINGNGLDNRRCNLRGATNAQNQWNRRSKKRFRGVRYIGGPTWQAILSTGGRAYTKTCRSEIGAALAYNELARKHFGEYARLNRVGEITGS